MTLVLAVAVLVNGYLLLTHPTLGWKHYVFAGCSLIGLVCSVLFDHGMYVDILVFIVEPITVAVSLVMLILICREQSQKTRKGK